ncbi:MAG: YbjQ family protein [Acidobacteriota bacterium]
MIVTTTDAVPGRSIVRTLGLVRGSACRGRHLGRDLIAHLRNAVGGEIPEYTKMLSEAREQALDRMADEARALGGTGVIGVRFAIASMMAGAAEVLVYGTAVQLAAADVAPPHLEAELREARQGETRVAVEAVAVRAVAAVGAAGSLGEGERGD